MGSKLDRPVFITLRDWVMNQFPRSELQVSLDDESARHHAKQLSEAVKLRNLAAHPDSKKAPISKEDLEKMRENLIGTNGILRLYLLARNHTPVSDLVEGR